MSAETDRAEPTLRNHESEGATDRGDEKAKSAAIPAREPAPATSDAAASRAVAGSGASPEHAWIAIVLLVPVAIVVGMIQGAAAAILVLIARGPHHGDFPVLVERPHRCSARRSCPKARTPTRSPRPAPKRSEANGRVSAR